MIYTDKIEIALLLKVKFNINNTNRNIKKLSWNTYKLIVLKEKE